LAPPGGEDSSSAVTIVLPNYDGAELLRRFLPSVMDAARGIEPPAGVLVVDDASTDDSVRILREEFPQVTVLVNPRNLGFGATANRGVEAARSPFVVLLNTDAEPAVDLLDPLLERMREAPDVAAVVPRIMQVTTGETCESVVFGTFRRGLFRLERRPELCESEHPLPVLYPCGAAVMLRRDVFIELGGFDDLFAPFYWEDVDLGYRMWRAGHRVLYEPRSAVLHYHPGAIKATRSEERAHFVQDRNRFLFMWKDLDASLLLRHFALLPAHVVVSALTGRGRFVSALMSALPALPHALARRSARGTTARSSLDILERARPREGAPDAWA
jgi:GT2 family glycosyltransferase